MPRLKVNNYVFYRELKVSKEEIRYDDWRKGFFNKENLVRDIEEEFKINGASPAVPPYQTVVCALSTGKASIPVEGVTVDGVASPIITDSVLLKAEPALVTEVSV